MTNTAHCRFKCNLPIMPPLFRRTIGLKRYRYGHLILWMIILLNMPRSIRKTYCLVWYSVQVQNLKLLALKLEKYRIYDFYKWGLLSYNLIGIKYSFLIQVGQFIDIKNDSLIWFGAITNWQTKLLWIPRRQDLFNLNLHN